MVAIVILLILLSYKIVPSIMPGYGKGILNLVQD